MDCGDVSPRGPTYLTDYHNIPMDDHVFTTMQVHAVADWRWHTLLNTLLVRTISLVHTSRLISVDLSSLITRWRKRWWNSLQAKLRRQAMQEEYMAAHPPAPGQPMGDVLVTLQFYSCRLLYVTALHVRLRDYDRLVELWRCRALRSPFGHYRLYTDSSQDSATDWSQDPSDEDHDIGAFRHGYGGFMPDNWAPSSGWSSDYSSEDEHAYPMMRELVWLLAFECQEWRPPWPPRSNPLLYYSVPWCIRVYAAQTRSCSLLRVHGYSLLHRFDQDQDDMCCTEYAYTIGTNCWRALAHIHLEEHQPARLHVPSTVPHRCTGAFRHTSPMGHWELTHSQWCHATCPCARNLPLCLRDTTDWPVVKLPAVIRQYRRARRPAAPAAPSTDMQGAQKGPADIELQARANSTTALRALPTSLTGVGRQAPWSGANLAAPPWDLALPAPSCPVTSQDVTDDFRRAHLNMLMMTTASLILQSRFLSPDKVAWAYARLRFFLFRQ